MQTKDICSLLGITPQTIRLYEKHSAEFHYETDDKGWRLFPFGSLAQMFALRGLTKYGMTVKGATSLVLGASFSDLEKSYASCKDDYAVERRRLDLLESCIDDDLRYIEEARRLVDAFDVVESPSFWWVDYEEGNRSAEAIARRKWISEQWTAELPFIFFSPLGIGPQFSLDSEWKIGFGLEEKYVEPLGIRDPERYGMSFSSRRCLATTLRIQNPAPDYDILSKYVNYYRYHAILPLLKHAEKRGLKVVGSLMSRLIAVSVKDSDGIAFDYYLAWLPIE